MTTASLDLGSGPIPQNPFGADELFGLDVAAFEAVQNVNVCRLGIEPIPYKDNRFDFVTAFDLLEHIPRTGYGDIPNPFIFLMSQIHRVLVPGGLFLAKTPAYPYPTAFSDPTHVNIITSDTIRYFGYEVTGSGEVLADDRIELGQRYGFTGRFQILRNTSEAAWGHQVWLLRAEK